MTKQPLKTKLLNATTDNIKTVVEALKQGDVVGLPTETVYGLAGNALRDESIAKIFLFKSRPSFDPLIVHVPETLTSCQALADAEIINLMAMSQPQISTCDKLIQLFWPGPLTLIFPKHERISDLVTSSLPTVGLRSPSHPVAQQVLKLSGLPLAAPSANQFGRISPTKSQHVIEELGEFLNYCLEGGECSVGLESTIATVNLQGEVSVLRPGGVSLEALESCLEKSFRGLHTELGLPSVASHSPMAPGLLESHYAPKKQMFRLETRFQEFDFKWLKENFAGLKAENEELSLLSPFPLSAEIHRRALKNFNRVNFHYLAEDENDSLTAAHTLFSKLRELDSNPSALILCELPQSDKALWPAIRDRLTRASKKWSL